MDAERMDRVTMLALQALLWGATFILGVWVYAEGAEISRLAREQEVHHRGLVRHEMELLREKGRRAIQEARGEGR